MTSNEVHEMYEQMKDAMSADTLLNELYNAMSKDEAEANLKYIARMWDMDIFDK